MAGKKGAKKTVGKARKGDLPKQVMKLYYVRKDNGAVAPKYERIPTEESATAEA
ncbi:MAG: hypothetical protein Kow00124_14780 [Anaerolineae bacterium]